MNIANLNKLSNEDFKGVVGIDRHLFFQLAKKHGEECPIANRQRVLPPIYELLITLIYLRQHLTMSFLAVTYQVSKSTICRTIERVEAFLSENMQLPGISSDSNTIVCVDCTEIRIERPTNSQEASYSGKKKAHTAKVQVIYYMVKCIILSVVVGKGSKHDFQLFRESELTKIGEGTQILADSGYEGLDNYHENSLTPFKRKKGQLLSKFKQIYNQVLAKSRIRIEHINRLLKVFKILGGVYRGKGKKLAERVNIIACLVNIMLKNNKVN